MQLTLRAYIDGVSDGSLDPQTVIDFYVKKAKQENSKYNMIVRFHDDYIQQNLDTLKKGTLKGAPIVLKDNFLTKGYISSCGSKMLENYVAPYSATCFETLEKNGGLMIGKGNMDEFAMGSSTETSYFGVTYNPYGTGRVPGGSSGGSAVAVASDCCLGALGTDTSGSVRQPAALCGIVGMKPTYGMVSRSGVQSMASSLDQVGVFTKTVEDAEILLKAVAGFDEKDSQSDPRADEFLTSKPKKLDVKKLKIALPKEVFSEGLDPRIKELLLQKVEQLRALGCDVQEVSLPVLSYGIPLYYSLMPAELGTNLARFDGIKFGLQNKSLEHDDLASYYQKIRSEGFGDEAKRRILLSSFVLSSANYEGYYLRAQKIREQMIQDVDTIFETYDFILGPTTPSVAWKMGERSADPIQMYLEDFYTVSANICGGPAMTVPMGMIDDNGEKMPAGIHFMAQRWEEEKLFAFGKVVENL
ncbi:MAG: Asp-tRNA(Asn)/Glu-tRNA(Gln) amidotransferase subunit GatA [candidate division SR1 bacterium]|nr:Asp-tRNA(Asn)/Glu-tRNA(Gln) amidotransferase subunit GatA [candidate division SR1 bacterium]